MLSIEGFRFRIGTFDAKLEPHSTYLTSLRTHSCSQTAGKWAKCLRSPAMGAQLREPSDRT
jgi:hypothetical protein